MRGKILGWIGGLGAIGVGVALAVTPMVLPPAEPIEVRAESGCDLQRGPCSAELPGGGRMTLVLTPRPVIPMRAVSVQATFDNVLAREVSVDFKGVDMNMGDNRFVLGPDGSGRFSGTASLSVCIRDRMEWDAWLLANTDQGLFTAPFRFETRRQ